MLELRDVEAHYGRIQALYGVSLQVARGEIVCLVGSNGAGKSTTLLTIIGLVQCTGGSICFGGDELRSLPTDEIVRRGIAVVPEGRKSFPTLTIEENLLLGAHVRGRGDYREDLERVYSLFPVLAERSRQLGSSLSGGEQQMLGIGRALMARPQLLLLDEPSLGLAPRMVDVIYETMLTVRASGVTILLVDQNAERALEVSDRGYIMENGVITLSGDAASLLKDDRVRQSYLGV